MNRVITSRPVISLPASWFLLLSSSLGIYSLLPSFPLFFPLFLPSFSFSFLLLSLPPSLPSFIHFFLPSLPLTPHLDVPFCYIHEFQKPGQKLPNIQKTSRTLPPNPSLLDNTLKMKFHLGNCFHESRTPNPALRALELATWCDMCAPHGDTSWAARERHLPFLSGGPEGVLGLCSLGLEVVFPWEHLKTGGSVLSSGFIGTKFVPGFVLSLERDTGCTSAPKGQGESCPSSSTKGWKLAVLLGGGSPGFYHEVLCAAHTDMHTRAHMCLCLRSRGGLNPLQCTHFAPGTQVDNAPISLV